jgi:hypothetical protein
MGEDCRVCTRRENEENDRAFSTELEQTGAARAPPEAHLRSTL